MKKVSVFFLAVVFAIACTNDNQEATVVNDTAAENFSTARGEGETLETLYNNMIGSESYLNYKAASDDFVDKMNFDGILEDIDTDEKILDWVTDNIDKTDFDDLADATKKFNNLKAMSLTVVETHFSFYEAAADEPILAKDLTTPEPPLSTEGCPVCVAAFKSDIDTLLGQFINEVIDAVGSISSGGGTAAGLTISKANLVFTIGVQNATETFINCCVG